MPKWSVGYAGSILKRETLTLTPTGVSQAMVPKVSFRHAFKRTQISCSVSPSKPASICTITRASVLSSILLSAIVSSYYLLFLVGDKFEKIHHQVPLIIPWKIDTPAHKKNSHTPITNNTTSQVTIPPPFEFNELWIISSKYNLTLADLWKIVKSNSSIF